MKTRMITIIKKTIIMIRTIIMEIKDLQNQQQMHREIFKESDKTCLNPCFRVLL